MNNRPRNSSKTKNHKFWENFYWGNGGMASQAIIDNRDLFYSVFQSMLFKCKSNHLLKTNHHNNNPEEKYVSMSNEVSDHSEYYRIKNTKIRIILFHPYYISQENTDFVKKNGFREIKPMYSTDARSFMKIVDNVSKRGNTLTEVSYYDFTPLLL